MTQREIPCDSQPPSTTTTSHLAPTDTDDGTYDNDVMGGEYCEACGAALEPGRIGMCDEHLEDDDEDDEDDA
jgi:hypothetical protein